MAASGALRAREALEFVKTEIDSWEANGEYTESALQSALSCRLQLARSFTSNKTQGGPERGLWDVLWNIVHEQLYLSALELCKAGAFESADVLLDQMGFKFRLSNICWHQCSTSLSHAVDASILIPPGATGGHANLANSSNAVPERKKPSQMGDSRKDQAKPSQVGDSNTILEAKEGQPPLLSEPLIFDFTQYPVQAIHPAASTSNTASVGVPQNATDESSFDWMEIIARLSAAFSRDSPFWTDHHYGQPGTPFFSFLTELDQPPTSIVELCIHKLALCLSQGSSTTAIMEDVRHAEWWAHIREPGGCGHQLHFDVNETHLRKGRSAYTLSHPILSSVLYLSKGAASNTHYPKPPPPPQPALTKPSTTTSTASPASGCSLAPCPLKEVRGGSGREPTRRGPPLTGGAPTLVIDQCASDAQLGLRGWAAHPSYGRYLVFPGNFLHGVLPGQSVLGGAHVQEAGSPPQEPGQQLREGGQQLQEAGRPRQEPGQQLQEAELPLQEHGQQPQEDIQQMQDGGKQLHGGRQQPQEYGQLPQEGRQQLQDGRQQLQEGRQQLQEGRQQLQEGRQYHQEVGPQQGGDQHRMDETLQLQTDLHDRITLIVAWWPAQSNMQSTSYPVEGNPQLLQPCMRGPRAGVPLRGGREPAGDRGGGGDCGMKSEHALNDSMGSSHCPSPSPSRKRVRHGVHGDVHGMYGVHGDVQGDVQGMPQSTIASRREIQEADQRPSEPMEMLSWTQLFALSQEERQPCAVTSQEETHQCSPTSVRAIHDVSCCSLPPLEPVWSAVVGWRSRLSKIEGEGDYDDENTEGKDLRHQGKEGGEVHESEERMGGGEKKGGWGRAGEEEETAGGGGGGRVGEGGEREGHLLLRHHSGALQNLKRNHEGGHRQRLGLHESLVHHARCMALFRMKDEETGPIPDPDFPDLRFFLKREEDIKCLYVEK